jgi:hypothetical protein
VPPLLTCCVIGLERTRHYWSGPSRVLLGVLVVSALVLVAALGIGTVSLIRRTANVLTNRLGGPTVHPTPLGLILRHLAHRIQG